MKGGGCRCGICAKLSVEFWSQLDRAHIDEVIPHTALVDEYPLSLGASESQLLCDQLDDSPLLHPQGLGE